MTLTQNAVILNQRIILLIPANFKYKFADIKKILSTHFKLQRKKHISIAEGNKDMLYFKKINHKHLFLKCSKSIFKHEEKF